jgi:hypothetical protein
MSIELAPLSNHPFGHLQPEELFLKIEECLGCKIPFGPDEVLLCNTCEIWYCFSDGKSMSEYFNDKGFFELNVNTSKELQYPEIDVFRSSFQVRTGMLGYYSTFRYYFESDNNEKYNSWCENGIAKIRSDIFKYMKLLGSTHTLYLNDTNLWDYIDNAIDGQSFDSILAEIKQKFKLITHEEAKNLRVKNYDKYIFQELF